MKVEISNQPRNVVEQVFEPNIKKYIAEIGDQRAELFYQVSFGGPFLAASAAAFSASISATIASISASSS